MKNWNILFIFLLLVGVSCNSTHNSSSDESSSIPNSNNSGSNGVIPAETADFNGIDSITNITDTSMTLNWTHSSGVVAYLILDQDNNTIAVVQAPAASYQVNSLTPNTQYQFKIKASLNADILDRNDKILSETTLVAPLPPTQVEIISPIAPSGVDTILTARVSGVYPGQTVKLFSDETCTTEVASGVATSDTIELNTSALTVIKVHILYANTTGMNTSECSSASDSYEHLACPIGYIPVPGNATYSTSDFCVMQFEAKAWEDTNNDGIIDSSELDSDGCFESGCTTANWGTQSKRAVSHAEGAPWRMISPSTASSMCDRLNSEAGNTAIINDTNNDGTFALISNPEWMTIARNIETVGSNWISGCIKQGNIGSSGCGGVAGYNGAKPESGASRNNLAQMELSNGQLIWDFSGNLWEAVDWNLSRGLTGVAGANKAQLSTDAGTTSAARQLNVLDVNVGVSDIMHPDTFMQSNTSLTSSDGIGLYVSGGTNTGAALRGGDFSLSTSGIYYLSLRFGSTSSFNDSGFRCVYRP